MLRLSKKFLGLVVSALVVYLCSTFSTVQGNATLLSAPQGNANYAVLPTTYTVTTTADTVDGNCDLDCSIRDAIIKANLSAGTDTIVIPAGVYVITRSTRGEDAAWTGDYDITDSVNIVGDGTAETIIGRLYPDQHSGSDRVFQIALTSSNITVSMTGLRIRNANPSAFDNGGGILNNANLILDKVEVDHNNGYSGGGIYNNGTLTITRSSIRSNSGTSGGGINNSPTSTLTITDTTISENKIGNARSGGGIQNSGVLTLTNSTLSGNTSSSEGGAGLSNNGTATLNNVTVYANHAFLNGQPSVFTAGLLNQGSLNIRNSIVWGNTGTSDFGQFNCYGTLFSLGNNIIGDRCTVSGNTASNMNIDPMLGALGDNGGPTFTHPLLNGSPAIDAADSPSCIPSDQRGFARAGEGAACDIGAYELVTAPALLPPSVVEVAGGSTVLIEDGSFDIDASLLRVTFGEAMLDPQGDSEANDVTNPANYRLLTGGADLQVETTTCAATIGDDISIPLQAASYDDAAHAVSLGFSGTTPLPKELYRLIVCASLEDQNGNRLDGNRDTYAGDDFVRTFKLDERQTTPVLSVNRTLDTRDGFCGVAHCSLREAVIAANAAPGSTIQIPAGVFTITGSEALDNAALSGDLDINTNMTIRGAGAANTRILVPSLNGGFDIRAAANVFISDLWFGDGGEMSVNAYNYYATVKNVSGGNVVLENIVVTGTSGTQGYGTGLMNWGANARMTVRNSTIQGMQESGLVNSTGAIAIVENSTFTGNRDSGIRNVSAVLTVTNSTFVGNSASTGGAIFSSGTSATLQNVTITGNTATSFGGGIANINLIRNSIISGNTVASYPADCYGTIHSGGSNIIGSLIRCTFTPLTSDRIGAPPMLGGLADNGGQTQTRALLPNSPAISAGAECPAVDQRGQPRDDGGCDIGAFEAVFAPVVFFVNTVPAYNGTVLFEGELNGPVSALKVTFSELMDDPIGVSDSQDMSNPANYRLFEAGIDQRLESTACAAAQGDDIEVTIASVAVEGARTATLTINGGSVLEQGMYILIICDTVEGADGSALDGDRDGASGGSFSLTFSTIPAEDTAQPGPNFHVTVTTDTRDGRCGAEHCSLREAVIAANSYAGGGATVHVPQGIYRLTIGGHGEDAAACGDLDILAPMTIVGAGATQTIIDGNATDRVFHLPPTPPGVNVVTFSDLTMQNGYSERGSGLRIERGTATVLRSHVRDNTALVGAGIHMYSANVASSLNLEQSAIFGNTGGALAVDGLERGAVRLIRSTITDNIGRMENRNTAFTYDHDTIVDSAYTSMHAVTSTYSIHTDIASAAAHLGPLQDNGGPTFTRALLPMSVHIGVQGACGGSDQRGFPRDDGRCDAGAYEADYPPAILGVLPVPLTPTDDIQFIGNPLSEFVVNFSEQIADPSGDIEPLDVTNPASYRLVFAGADGTVQTNTCGVLSGDDTLIDVNSVLSLPDARARVNVNNGAALSDGSYRLIMCGERLVDQDANALDADRDGVSGGDAVYSYRIQQRQSGPAFAVNTTEDAWDGVCGIAHCSIREAIITANGYGLQAAVTIPAGTFTLTRSGAPENTARTGDLDVTASMSITGAGAGQTIIDGNQLDSVFDVILGNPRTVLFERLTVRNGRHTQGGGINFSAGSGKIIIAHSDIVDNIATGIGGGGVYVNSAANVTISDSRLMNNEAIPATNPPGGNGIGGGILSYSLLTVTNSTISDNTAANSGAGLYATGLTRAVTITNSAITRNNTLVVPANQAVYNRGGGIYNETLLTLANVTISNNSAANSGGGIYSTRTLNLNNVTLADNTTDSNSDGLGDGGGIHYDPQGTPTATMVLQNSLLSGNRDFGGEAPDCWARVSIPSLDYNLISDITGCVLTGQLTHNIIGENAFVAPLGDNGGGTETHALLAQSPAIDAANPTNCTLVDQRSVPRDYGDACDIGAYESANHPLELIPPVVVTAKTVGAATAISQLTLTFNEAVRDPAGNSSVEDVTNPASYLIISDGADNTFQTLNCDVVMGDDQGFTINSVTYDNGLITATLNVNGGVALTPERYHLLACGNGAITDLNGNALDGNRDGIAGGDYTFLFYVDVPQTETVLKVTVPEDRDDGMCGVVHCTLREAVNAANAVSAINLHVTTTVDLPAGTYLLDFQTANVYQDIDVVGNIAFHGESPVTTIIDAGSHSRIFWIKGGDVRISDLTLQNGRVFSNEVGGAIRMNDNASLTLINAVVRNNIASAGSGGGIYTNAPLYVYRTLFENNQALYGGGGAIAVLGVNSLLRVEDSEFRSNSATLNLVGGGGGVYNESSTALITGSLFTDNVGEHGGAIHAKNGSITITNSTIVNNRTVGGGGGGIRVNPLASVTLNNVTITGNVGDGPEFSDGSGGGLSLALNADLYMENSLVYGNTVLTGTGPDCSTDRTEVTSRDYNLIGDISDCTISSETAHNIIGQDPLLGSLQNNGGRTHTVALQAGSPAIDAGNTPNCEPTDQRGVQRPQGPSCDIGAYEQSGGAPVEEPPTVLGVTFSSATDDGDIAENAVIPPYPSLLELTFSTIMRNPGGHSASDDVTNPDNYRIIDAGSNGTIETQTCDAPAGDDELMVLEPIVFGTSPMQVRLTLHNGGILFEGSYRLIACATLYDMDGHALDGNGDGIEGDAFVRNFRVYNSVFVTQVTALTNVGSMPLTEGSAIGQTINQLTLSFNKALSTSSASNSLNYRLVSAGADKVLQTTTCAAVLGDDVSILINTAQYNSASLTVTLSVNNGTRLGSDGYRLLACGTLTDSRGNPIDGDHDINPGGDFKLSFLIDVPQSAATLVVNTTSDAGDGTCGVWHCSLRDAITAANTATGTNTIAFNLQGSGVQTIRPLSALPEVTGTTIIDGRTDPDFLGTPIVGIDGADAGSTASGLVIRGANSVVRGLVVTGFAEAGIHMGASNVTAEGNYVGIGADGITASGNDVGIFLTSSNSLIGGTTSAARNIIAGNRTGIQTSNGGLGQRIYGNYIGTNAAGTQAVPNVTGILAQSVSLRIGSGAASGRNVISGNTLRGITLQSDNNIVAGNLIGTNATGTLPIANGIGVQVYDANNLVGGVTSGARNIISGNDQGVVVGTHCCLDENNTVQGNFIGTDITGAQALANRDGIYIYGHATIGGAQPGAGNVISGNREDAIHVDAASLVNIYITGNIIGTDIAQTHDLGNGGDGIFFNGYCCTIGGINAGEGNVIVNNDGNGISFQLGRVLIGRNSIANNDGLGIDIFRSDDFGRGATPNDAGDGDVGPNGFQNYPEIHAVPFTTGNTVVEASMHSEPSSNYRIEFFSNSTCDAEGNAEGEHYEGSLNVTTDAVGDVTPFTYTLSHQLGAGQFVTATATKLGTAGTETTSEFSPCMPTAVPFLTATMTATDVNGGLKHPGDTLRYTVTIANIGGAVATGAVFTDAIPTYTTYVPDTTSMNGEPVPDNAGQMPFAVGASINSEDSAAGIVRASESVVITFDVVVNPILDEVNTISNQGTIVYAEAAQPVLTDDPATTAPIDPTVVVMVAFPVVDAVKTVTDVNGGTTNPGDVLRYTITVTNSGKAAALNTVFTDSIPMHSTYRALSTTLNGVAVPDTGGQMPFVSGSLVNNVGSAAGVISATESAVITFDVTVGLMPVGVRTISNQGTVTYNPSARTNLTDDPTTQTLNDATITQVIAAPVLNAVKTVSDVNGGAALPGDVLRYTITILNAGNAAASGVSFTDSIPANVTYVATSTTMNAASVPDTAGQMPFVSGRLVNNPGSAAGVIIATASTVITFDVTVGLLPAGVNTVSNQGSINYTGAVQPVLTDDATTQTLNDATLIQVTGAPVIAATKTVSDINGGTTVPGDVLRYTITIVNGGNAAANGVSFTDAIPANATYVAASAKMNGASVPDTAGQMPFISGRLVNNAGSAAGVMSATASAAITFDVIVNPMPAGVNTLSNQGSITYAGAAQLVATDNPATQAANDATITQVIAAPVLTAVKTVADTNGGYVMPGDVLRYTVVIHNSGTQQAANVAFNDTVDANTTLVPNTVVTTGGTVISGNSVGAPSISINVGLMNSGGQVSIRYDVVIDDLLPQGSTSVQNQGTVTGTNHTSVRTDDNGSGSDATVLPVMSRVSISADFLSSVINANEAATLRITMTNPSGNPALSDLRFTALLPQGLAFGTVTSPQCGGLVSQSAQTLTFTGGAISGSAHCVVDVQVTAAGSASGLLTVSTSTLSGLGGMTSTTGDSASIEVRASLSAPSLTAPANGASIQTLPTLTWQAAPGALRYEVQLSRSDRPLVTVATVTGSSYTPGGPLLTTRYAWRVRALGEGEQVSGWSATWQFTIVSENNAVPQLGLVTERTKLLTWGRISWATEYEIQVDTTPTFIAPYSFTATTPSTNREITVSLVQDGTYFWRVRARRSDGAWGAWSTVSTFTVAQ